MSNNIDRELTSIIIPVWGQLEFTQQCLASLKEHTRPAWELIVIDNGSNDATAAYLAGVRDMASVPVTVVTNTTNLGFPAAINQGLRLARGEYLVLLNNDVVVTDGWLDQLIALVNAKRSSLVSGQWSVVADGKTAEREGLITPPMEQPQVAPPYDGDALHDAESSPAPRAAIVPGAAESSPPPCVGIVPGSAESTPPGPPSTRGGKVCVDEATRPTPPGPPFTRGGKVMRPSSADPAGAGVDDGEQGAAACSLPTADRLLPAVRPIGLVGPMSNFVAPPQLVENVPYRDVNEMHRFAKQWRDERRKQWFTVPKLSGFCLLMKRAVYDKIGGLDERFGLGLFDDDDLAERARRAGFELAVARDLFVHHFGSRTFLGNGIDIDGLLEENGRRFAAKWGLAGGSNGHQVVALRPWKQPAEGVGNGVSAGSCATPGGRGSVRAAMASAGSDGASPSQDRANAPNGVPEPRVRVAWEGDFDALHSLAIVNRAVCRGLIDRGHDVRLIANSTLPAVETDERVELDAQLRQRRLAVAGTSAARDGLSVFDAQVHVRHCWPPVIEPPARGKWVLMQPWEFGSLPKAWVPMLRRVDEVWAYSRYVRDCFLEAEVPRDKVHVVPLGIAPEVFRPGVEPFALQAGPEIRLLFVGGTIHRKGIDVLLSAFSRAFRSGDGVGLVIKEMGSKSFYRGQTAEAQIAALRERGYSVEYIDRILSEAEMAGLYCACDGLVQPFRGEGFGLPIVEAMVCGLPVIITGAGPALDYACDKTAYFIPAERQPLVDGNVDGMETIGQPWLFEPDADALVDLLKRVVSDRDGARAIGTAASAHIREHFTWARTVEAVEQRLRALAQEPMRPPTRSASEGLYRPSAKSSGTPTRSASEGLHTMRVQPEHPQTDGDGVPIFAGVSCDSGQTLARVGVRIREPSLALRVGVIGSSLSRFRLSAPRRSR